MAFEMGIELAEGLSLMATTSELRRLAVGSCTNRLGDIGDSVIINPLVPKRISSSRII